MTSEPRKAYCIWERCNEKFVGPHEHFSKTGHITAHAPDRCDRGEHVSPTEARAAAERDVAALRTKAGQWRHAYHVVQGHTLALAVCGDGMCGLIAKDLAEANPAAAEPRWPSGPDAERELAAALDEHFGGRCIPDTDSRALIAALQEKRDPGE